MADDRWWENCHNLALLLADLLDCESDADECRRIVDHVLDKPWKWRAEFIRAKCRAQDSAEVHA